ncbi:MAG: hypothetical protein F6K16_34730 [Symploca sp. SIO2B6]|nr:hypothetical protein [Symploca sp. SIO2B6]
MDESRDSLAVQVEALKDEIAAMRSLQERQQESITSLIALSQQQTAVIEQQNAVINRLVSNNNGVVPNAPRLVGNPSL